MTEQPPQGIRTAAARLCVTLLSRSPQPVPAACARFTALEPERPRHHLCLSSEARSKGRGENVQKPFPRQLPGTRRGESAHAQLASSSDQGNTLPECAPVVFACPQPGLALGTESGSSLRAPLFPLPVCGVRCPLDIPSSSTVAWPRPGCRSKGGSCAGWGLSEAGPTPAAAVGKAMAEAGW